MAALHEWLMREHGYGGSLRSVTDRRNGAGDGRLNDASFWWGKRTSRWAQEWADFDPLATLAFGGGAIFGSRAEGPSSSMQ